MPDAAFCDEVRQQYGLTDMPVLYDDGAYRDLGLPANHVHLVLSRGDKIESRSQYRNDVFEPVLDELLGR
jgi:hypothetical protein